MPCWGTSSEYHIICFHGEIRKISVLLAEKSTLSAAMSGQLKFSTLPNKFGVSWHFGSEGEAKTRFSRWRPSWISDRNDFSYFLSTSHPDASYQVSNQLSQGCRRSMLLKQLLTQHDGRRTMDDGYWLTTIAHHEHFMLRKAKKVEKFWCK